MFLFLFYGQTPLMVLTPDNLFDARWSDMDRFLTRNTFCGTWYLPHSRVHKSIAELCSNFGDSAITKSQFHIFHCACAKQFYFYILSVKIWRHHRVRRPRFPTRCRNFGDLSINMGQIAYFALRMRKTALFLLSVKNLTSPSCSPTPILYRMQEFWRFGQFFFAVYLN